MALLDHDYVYHCDCTKYRKCEGCVGKEKVIKHQNFLLELEKKKTIKSTKNNFLKLHL